VDGEAGRRFLIPKLSTGYSELSTGYPHLYPQQPVATGVAFEQRFSAKLSTGYPQCTGHYRCCDYTTLDKNHLTLPVTIGLNIEKMMNDIPVTTGYDITLYLTLDITVYTLVDSHGIHGQSR
jgi:hypothetical protein